MDSKPFVYPAIKVVPGDKVTISCYVNKAGEISLSFQSYDSLTKDSDLGFVIFRL